MNPSIKIVLKRVAAIVVVTLAAASVIDWSAFAG
jgi:hypothetical protein